MRVLLSYIWNKIILASCRYIVLRKDILRYRIMYPGIYKRIRKKETIKVVFFPINIGMWKCDYLFQLLQAHPKFDPYIVSFFIPTDVPEYQRLNQEEMRLYFKGKGYPYYDMYDFDNDKWFDINSFKPDVIFYTQPVNVGYKQYRIQSLWRNALFYYIPYCLTVENEKEGYNTLLFNICSKVFASSTFEKEYWSSFFFNKGKNISITGYPSFDYLTSPKTMQCNKWKINDGRKKIIWAPHHSVKKSDIFSYSNFLDVADEMLSIAECYQDELEIVFKPHPRLRPKLEKLPGWGIERTDNYYKKWEEMPNTNYVNGDYFDLFLSSDAMIHDCSTFMAEYLLTGNPVMFLIHDESRIDLNDYGKACFQQHYFGRSLEDVRHFVENVVIQGKDTMKAKRINFVNNFLKAGGSELVADKIFSEIKSDLL